MAEKEAFVTQDDLAALEGRLEQKINQAVEELAGIIREFANQVSDRFGQVDERFEVIDRRFEKVDRRLVQMERRFEQRFDKIESDISHLTNNVEDALKRLDNHDVQNATQDARINRLERWADKVATKLQVQVR